MHKLAVCFSLLFLIPAFAVSTHAQQGRKAPATVEAPSGPAHFYRLDFVLEQLDESGQPVNSRSFATTVSTAGSRLGSITVGTRVPIATGSYSTPGTTAAAAAGYDQTQFQYIDVGVKITARDVREDGNHLAFSLNAAVSSITTPVVLEGVSEPVIRNNVWNGDVLIPIGKPIVVSKSDSLDSKGSMQLIVTATPME